MLNLRRSFIYSQRMVWLAVAVILGAVTSSAAPCNQTPAAKDRWVTTSVDRLVSAARAFYTNDGAQRFYERAVQQMAASMKRCRLAEDPELAGRYPEFLDYMRLLSLSLDPEHELGFEVTDKVYFAETNKLTTIPDFLLKPNFLRAVSRFETLSQAKGLLRDMNAARAPNDKLIFFSYTSQHLGTPDNPDSYRRLLIVVPGNQAERLPEKWVQFGIPDPRKPLSVRNVSVVAVVPRDDGAANVYFKDYFRTFRRNGSITVKGRWELGEGDDNCVSCHKSGVLPIFPEAASVPLEEEEFVETVNERFLTYGKARFDRYLDTSRFGPGLGSPRGSQLFHQSSFAAAPGQSPVPACASCHHVNEMGPLNWPMDSTLISSFVYGGKMPLGAELTKLERARLYRQIIDDYFALDNARPGILKAWLLGKSR